VASLKLTKKEMRFKDDGKTWLKKAKAYVYLKIISVTHKAKGGYNLTIL